VGDRDGLLVGRWSDRQDLSCVDGFGARFLSGRAGAGEGRFGRQELCYT
jgi:hypothetical protein